MPTETKLKKIPKQTESIFAGDLLVATIEDDGETTTPYYIHSDQLNSSNVITDENGEMDQLLDYYPYGGERINDQISSQDTARKYIGQIRDENGLDYLCWHFKF